MADDLDREAHDADFDFDEADDFADTTAPSIGSVVQNNAMVKVAIIAGVFIVIIGGLVLFGGGDESETRSQMRVDNPGNVREVPGGEDELPPSYQDALEQYNEEGVEEAIKQDDSFIPVPTSPTKNTGIQVPGDGGLQEDPLERWRMLQEEAARQKQRQLAVEEEVDDGGAAERRRQAVQELASNMLASMEQLSSINYTRPLNSNDITSADYYAELFAEDEEGVIDPGAQLPQEVNVIIPEGEIEYAQMLIQANSDIPGPVLAQIVTGPLAGKRVVGSFSREEKYLVMTFETVIIDGQSVPINAVAVDPDTNLTGVVTDVDNRYFKRLILPVAANFIEGLAGAIAETRTTTTTTTDVTSVTESNNELDTEEEVATAIEEAGEKISEFVEEEADRTEILVKVAAGTPVGILFLEPVVEAPPASATTASTPGSGAPQFVAN